MPSVTRAQAGVTALPLTAQRLAEMSFEELTEVAANYGIDEVYITGFDQKELHEYLLLFFGLDKSPSPASAGPANKRKGKPTPLKPILRQRRRDPGTYRNPSPDSPEGYNIPEHERARPPQDTRRPTVNTRLDKPPGTPRPYDRNALNRRTPEETPEPDSDDGALASTEAIEHAIQLLREYRNGNIALKMEADEAIAEVKQLTKNICEIKQALIMQRALRKRLEAYIPYQRERPDTWELDQVFPDIPRFTQTLYGEEYEVDAVDADDDPHLKKLMDRNYSRNAEKLDNPSLNGNIDTNNHSGSDDENAEEENQVNSTLSPADPDEDLEAPSAPVPFNVDDASAYFSPVRTTIAKSQMLRMLVNSISREAVLAAQKIGYVEPLMDLKTFCARVQDDSAKGKLCGIDDVRVWVNEQRQDPDMFTEDEDKEWDAYLQLFDVVEAYFQIHCVNRHLVAPRVNEDGEPLGPYEIYWQDHCHHPWFSHKWAEAMKGYERYCEFSQVMRYERKKALSAAVEPAAASPAVAGPSQATNAVAAAKTPRGLKRTASQAALGHSAPDGASKFPSELPESQRASKQRKTGLGMDEVVRIRQQSADDEEREHDSAEKDAPAPRVWKGKGRMIDTPSPPGGQSIKEVVTVSSGSNSGDSAGKFPASWMKPKPVDSPVRASLEKRRASIRSHSSSSGGSDAGGPSAAQRRRGPPGRTPTRSLSPVPEKEVRWRKLLDTPVGEMRYRPPPRSFGGYDPNASPVSPSPAGPAPATIRRRYAKEASMQKLAGMAIGSAISKARASVSGLVRRMSGELSAGGDEGAGDGADEPVSPTPVAGPSRVAEPSTPVAGPSRAAGPSTSPVAGPSRPTSSFRRGGPHRVTRSRVVATYTTTAPAAAAPVAPPAPVIAPQLAAAAPLALPLVAVAAPAPAAHAPLGPVAAAATLATPPGSPVERRLRSRVVKKKRN